MLKDIEGVIFDLDGTLVDSMWVWEQIDIDYFKSLGIPMPDDLKDKINHLSFYETACYFKKTYKIEKSVEDICTEWNNMALYYYSNKVCLKKGVLEFLQYLKSNNIKIALATSNSDILLTAVLKNTNILNYFDTITTTNEVKNGKNAPDVYLLASKRLNIIPSKCLVFEDILEAMQGAKLANMKVCAVYDKYSDYNRNKIISTSDFYIKDFSEITNNNLK